MSKHLKKWSTHVVLPWPLHNGFKGRHNLLSELQGVTSVVKNAVFFSAMSHIVDGIDALSDAN